MRKLLKYTLEFTVPVSEDSAYQGVTDEELGEAGVEGPIDTDEKKLAMEKFFLEEGFVSIHEIHPDDGTEKITIELVDDPTDPDYLTEKDYDQIGKDNLQRLSGGTWRTVRTITVKAGEGMSHMPPPAPKEA